MAKAIREIVKNNPRPDEVQAKAVEDVLHAISKNKTAIVDTLEILGHLQDMGVLAALKGLLAERQQVAAIAMQQLNQPKIHHTLKNVMVAMQAIGNIEPEQLQKVLNGVSYGLEATKDLSTNGNSPGVWELVKTMREPEVRTSLATMVGFMRGMGESFQSEDSYPVQ